MKASLRVNSVATRGGAGVRPTKTDFFGINLIIYNTWFLFKYDT